MAATRMCPHCRAFIEPKAKICPYCDGEVGARFREPEALEGTALSGLIPQTHFTILILLAINFGIFVATMAWSMKLGGSGSFDVHGGVLNLFGAKERIAIVIYGEWWRLVTAGFLHGGVFHILMNSWVLFDLGAQVERLFGTARMLSLYLVSSICGFYASLYWTPAPSIGASAALSGLIGAMMAYGKRSGQSFVFSHYARWMVIIVIIGILPGFNIDNAAHIGGLIAGFLLGWVAASPRRSADSETLWKAAATVLVLITVASMALAYQNITLGFTE